MTIKEQVKELQDKIKQLNSEILFIRESCPHIHFSVQQIGSTGNFDPMDDGYTNYYKCVECGKWWQEDV